jgi:hypothetical protein
LVRFFQEDYVCAARDQVMCSSGVHTNRYAIRSGIWRTILVIPLPTSRVQRS